MKTDVPLAYLLKKANALDKNNTAKEIVCLCRKKKLFKWFINGRFNSFYQEVLWQVISSFSYCKLKLECSLINVRHATISKFKLKKKFYKIYSCWFKKISIEWVEPRLLIQIHFKYSWKSTKIYWIVPLLQTNPFYWVDFQQSKKQLSFN